MKVHWLAGLLLGAGCTLLHATPAARQPSAVADIPLAGPLNGADDLSDLDEPDTLDTDQPDDASAPLNKPSYDDVPVDAIRRFVSIYEKVKANYVEPVDDNELFENALHGLLSRLDPYSDYLDARTYEALLDFTEGEVAQTGLTARPLTGMDANWQVDQVDAGSPAARAGLQPGMLLYRIDSKSTRKLSLHDIEQLLRGAVGTTVELTVAEPGKHSRIVRVIRATPEDDAVKAISYPNGILVLKINAFQSQTARQINQAIATYQQASLQKQDSLKQDSQKENLQKETIAKTATSPDAAQKDKQQKGSVLTALTATSTGIAPGAASQPLKAVLLDLRDNPGGLLSAAVEVADLFLDQGLIVSTRGRGEPEQRYQALPPAHYAQLPVGILVNHYSASAAEVLAGAFQDHQRAVIMGETSYGKGSVQKLWPIADGYAIKLTVARYYTPKGRLIEGKGIQPDILLNDQPVVNTIDTTLDNAVSLLRKHYHLP